MIPSSFEVRAKARKMSTPNPLLPNRPNLVIPVRKLPKTRNSTWPQSQDYLGPNHPSAGELPLSKVIRAKPKPTNQKQNQKRQLRPIKFPLPSLRSLNLRLKPRRGPNPPKVSSQRVTKREQASQRLKDRPRTRPSPRLLSQLRSLRGELLSSIESLQRRLHL